MTLLNDIARCLGQKGGMGGTLDQCLDCERYLHRNTGGERTPFLVAANHGEPCQQKIKEVKNGS